MKAPERARPRELHLAARPVENLICSPRCTFIRLSDSDNLQLFPVTVKLCVLIVCCICSLEPLPSQLSGLAIECWEVPLTKENVVRAEGVEPSWAV